MKNNELLLWGGAAVAAYFLFIKPKQATPVIPVSTVTPIAPVATQTSATNNLLSTITNAVRQLTSGGSGSTTAISVQAPLSASGIDTIDTGSLTTTDIPITDMNLISGYIEEEMYS